LFFSDSGPHPAGEMEGSSDDQQSPGGKQRDAAPVRLAEVEGSSDDQQSPRGKQMAAHLAAFYSRFAPEKLKDGTVQEIVSDFRWVERECLPWRHRVP